METDTLEPFSYRRRYLYNSRQGNAQSSLQFLIFLFVIFILYWIIAFLIHGSALFS